MSVKITLNRDDLIDLSCSFAKVVKSMIEVSPDKPIIFEINGHYASGKSLVSDSVKAYLLQQPIEQPKWKHIETVDGELGDLPISISFVNARFDPTNLILLNTFNKHAHKAGVIFVTNRSKLNLGRVFSNLSVPKADIEVNVHFPEGEKRPRKIGPFEFGEKQQITKRVVTVIMS